MTNPRASVVQGPAIVKMADYSYYFDGDLTVRLVRETTPIKTSMHGQIDERLKSQIWQISGTPSGMADTVAKYFPYDVGDIGAPIFSLSADVTLEILTLAGEKITYNAGAITKMPTLNLGVARGLFGDMEFTCLGKVSTEQTDAAYFKTVATLAFSDATFDETKLLTSRYTAAYGATPYDAMESKEGFEVELAMTTRPQPVDNYGVVNMILTSLTATARFTPAGLTEAQIDTLLAHQGASAILPGDSLAKAGTDLVISGTGVSVTVHKAGPKQGELHYDSEADRLGQLEFSSQRSWTEGVADALWTVAFS